jgi:GIY-YIG catalytic domain
VADAGIYGIFHRTEKRVYIGLAHNITSRWNQHRAALRTRSAKGAYANLVPDLQEEDIDSIFLFERLELVDLTGLLRTDAGALLGIHEKAMGLKYRAMGYQLYNEQELGGPAAKHSERSRKKLSASLVASVGRAIVNLDTGKRFASVNEAGTSVGVKGGAIAVAIRDAAITSGHRWAYEGDEEGQAARYAWAAKHGYPSGPHATYPDPAIKPGGYARWRLLDELSTKLGRIPSIAEAHEAGIAQGQKITTMSKARSHWIRYHEFHGLTLTGALTPKLAG